MRCAGILRRSRSAPSRPAHWDFQTLTPRRAAAGAAQFTLPRMDDYEVIEK
jgi:hypothetical protein